MGIKQVIKKHLEKKRIKIIRNRSYVNNDVTILSNCCIGGAMYHDLGLQFLSPTINLYFDHHCFIDYVRHLKEYSLKGKLVDSKEKEAKNGAPIAFLICEGLPKIKIHFLHYNSFEEAKEKWETRSERINYNKIFLVIEAKDNHEHSLIDEYASLPYKKIIFTNLESEVGRSVLHMGFYDKHPKGNITSFVGLSGKKGYDSFDFVDSIFNNLDWEESKLS